MQSIESLRKRNRQQNYWLLLAFFLFTLWISWGFPPTGDDWNRLVFSNRTFQGYLDLVKSHYETLNGRVLGNLLSYVLIEPPILRYLSKALAILALTVLTAKLSGIRSRLALFMGFFFVMTAPRLIFIQVYTWTSGFFNYVPPMIGILLLFQEMQPLFRGRPMKDGAIKTVLYFFLGIAICLFVEHVTLFSLLLAFAILGIQLFQCIKPAAFSVSFLFGTLLGNTLMFSSPIYRKILFEEDSYRTVPKTAMDFVDILLQNYRAFSRYMLLESPVFLLIVCLVCIVTLFRKKKQSAFSRFVLIWFGLLPTVVLVTRVLFSRVFDFTLANMERYYFLPVAFDFLLHLVTFIFLLYVGLSTVTNPAWRKQYTFTLLCVPVIVAPLFVVRPVLARNYYASYLFLAIAVLLLLQRLLQYRHIPLRRFTKWTILVCTSLCLFYGGIYTANKISFQHRVRVIEAGMEQKMETIVIPDYPVPFFVFGPGDSSLGHMYYYEKANDITFVLESESELQEDGQIE